MSAHEKEISDDNTSRLYDLMTISVGDYLGVMFCKLLLPAEVLD